MPETRVPLNYTTKIPARKTIAECQDLLARAGAISTSVQYRDRQPVGLAFEYETQFGVRAFAMPVAADGIAAQMKRLDAEHGWPAYLYKGGAGSKNRAHYMTREHATDVAWRIAKDWLEAQLAIIDASMVTLDQVMLPYLHIEGQTLYDRYLETERRAIEQ